MFGSGKGLRKRYDRLLWLERRGTRGEVGPLTERGEAALDALSAPDGRSQAASGGPDAGVISTATTHTNVGTLEAPGRQMRRPFVDAHCSLGLAKRYLSKLPITGVDLSQDRVLRLYEEQRVQLERVLTENCRE